MKYLKKQNIACFSRKEIDYFYKNIKFTEIIKKMNKKELSLADLIINRDKIENIVDSIVAESGKDKDEVEIFVASYMFCDFYGDKSECCFYMKDGFNPEKNKIENLDDLKKAKKESSLIDFLILVKYVLKAFQLKRYRGKLTTQDLSKFIIEKLKHYGKNLGNVNLLILIQPQGTSASCINFKELNKEISKLNLTFKGNILIWFNEANKFDVIVEIYPKYHARKIPTDSEKH